MLDHFFIISFNYFSYMITILTASGWHYFLTIPSLGVHLLFVAKRLNSLWFHKEREGSFVIVNAKYCSYTIKMSKIQYYRVTIYMIWFCCHPSKLMLEKTSTDISSIANVNFRTNSQIKMNLSSGFPLSP